MRVWMFLLILGIAVVSRESEACSCAGPKTEAEAIAAADAVFEGDVVSLTVRPSDRHGIASIVVRSVTKGAKKDAVVTVDSGAQASAMCGFFFTKGKRYIVFAYAGANGTLTTSKCTMTREAGTPAPRGGRAW